MIDINGSWTGFYSYGEGYSQLTQLVSVPFSVSIKKEFEWFVGRVIEDVESGGIEDEILIKGQLRGRKIEFTKYYTLEHLVDKDDNSASFQSVNPTIVHYEGEFSEEESKFKGVWEIGYLEEDDLGTMQESNTSGFWEMWKD